MSASTARRMRVRTVAIPDDMWEALQALATEHGTNASAIIREAIRATLHRHGGAAPLRPTAARLEPKE